MPLQSHIESLTRGEIRGWAFDPAIPAAPVRLDLILGGMRVASATADQPRPDLATLGFGTSNFGFVVKVPERVLLDVRSARLVVVETGEHLPGLAEAACYEGVFEQVSGTLITGWAWHSWTVEERVTVLIRSMDRVIARVSADRMRSDLRAIGMGDGRYGFECEMRSLPNWQQIDPMGLRCVCEPSGEVLYDMRIGKTPALPRVLPATGARTLYSAKGPGEQSAAVPPAAVPAPVAAPAPVVRAQQPAEPPATAQTKVERLSIWRKRTAEQRAAARAVPAIQRVSGSAPVDNPVAPAAPEAPAKPLSPELLEALRDAIDFGEKDPFA